MNLLNIGWCKGYFNGRKKILKLGLQCSVLRTGINPFSWIISRFDYIVGDLVSFRGPFFVKSNLECLTCSLYVSKPKKLGLKIRATVFGRFWANFRAKNKNTNF